MPSGPANRFSVAGKAKSSARNRVSRAGKTSFPPDIAVEIDITNDSLSKFHIYAALEVPEIWRYDGENFQFYQRAGASYHKTAESSVLPGLRPQMLASALEQSKTEGQTAALAAFRKTLTGVSGLRDDPRRSS